MPYSSPTIEAPHSELSRLAPESLADVPAPMIPQVRDSLLPNNPVQPNNASASTPPTPTSHPHPHPHLYTHSHSPHKNQPAPPAWGCDQSTSYTHAGTQRSGNVEYDPTTVWFPALPRTLSPPPTSATSFAPSEVANVVPNNSSWTSDDWKTHQQPECIPSSPLKSSLKVRKKNNPSTWLPSDPISLSFSCEITSYSTGCACEESSSQPTSSPPAKCVHFAAEDDVLPFRKSRRPSSLLSRSTEESSATESEAEPPRMQFGDFNIPLSFYPATRTSSRASMLFHGKGSRLGTRATKMATRIVLSTAKSSPIPSEPGLIQASPGGKVHLESVCLRQISRHSSSPLSGRGFEEHHHPTLHGTILVENFCYEKIVCVRFSLDEWQTVNEVSATWDSTVSESSSETAERWDRFEFNIDLSSIRDLGTRRLLMAVRYKAEGGVYWDNNAGLNFCFVFESEPLLSPSTGAPTHTTASPIMNRTGKPSIHSTNASSRHQHQHIPHLPPRRLTLKETSVFPHLFTTGTGTRAHSDPSAYYNALHLNLSNYISPVPPLHPSLTHPQKNSESTSASNSGSPPPRARDPSDQLDLKAQSGASTAASNSRVSGCSTSSPIVPTIPAPKHYTFANSCRAHTLTNAHIGTCRTVTS